MKHNPPFAFLVWSASMNDTSQQSSELQVESQIKKKWGDAVSSRGGVDGFLALPYTLIRNQSNLGLSSTEMLVLINVLSFWWSADKRPFPGNQVIAERMGVDQRTVQRAMQKLEDKKLIRRETKRLASEDKNDYRHKREIYLTGLVSYLQAKGTSADEAYVELYEKPST